MYSEKDKFDFAQQLKVFLCIAFMCIFNFSFSTQSDTATINSLTKRAYLLARKNPGLSIKLAARALEYSESDEYLKGIADANLALGAAYLAKYNPGDSAKLFYNKALDSYTSLNDNIGKGRASYGLSYLYNFKSSRPEAIKYGNLSVKYFEAADSQRELIAALEAVIFLEKQGNNYENAIQLSDKAIKISCALNDTLQWANALNNKGNVLKDMLLFNPSIDAYFEAFKLWELKNDTLGLSLAYGSIANAYFFEGDYKKSLEYNFKKLPITKHTGNNWETNKTLNNISLSYSELNKRDSAIFYMKESLKTAKEMNYPEGMANSFDNMASTFLSLGNPDSTLFYSSKAVAIAEQINSPNLPKYQINKAMAFNHQQKYYDALALAKKSYKRAKQKNDNHTLKDAAWLLNDIYYHQGKRNLAYPFLTEYLKLSDSISNMEYMRKVTRLDIQHEYETEQKKAQYEIDLLEKNNQLKTERLRKTWIVLIAILLLSIAGAGISFLLIKNKENRIEKMNLEIRNYLFQLEKLKADSKKHNPINELAKNYGLTQRETEIMELIATGIGNEDIADKLFVSKNTIKFHIKNIFIKLDVRNRVQALQKMAD